MPSFPNACASGPGSTTLTGEVTALDWAPYPGLSPVLWVPTVTFELCNPGTTPFNGWFFAKTRGGSAFESEEPLELPPLAPGEGTGPIKLYLPVGLPQGLYHLVEQGRLPWPEIPISLFVEQGGRTENLAERSLAVPAGRSGVSLSGWQLPSSPSPELLRAVNWTGRQVRSASGELFLYAPVIRFQVQGLIGCNPPGGLGVRSQEWSLYSLPQGGQPHQVGSLGEWLFQSDYLWELAERPQIRQTFLLLHAPNHCHYPRSAVFWLFDPSRGALARPTITIDGTPFPAGAPAPVLEADGGLTTYDLAQMGEGDAWTMVTYRWDAARLNWSLEGPAPSTEPDRKPPERGGAQTGPGGAPSTPGDVYAKLP